MARKPECPDEFDAAFGKRLVRYLGGDSKRVGDDWCWRQFAEAFPELREAAEEYFAEATTGNPAWAAYWMHSDCDSQRRWAEGIIANATTGNPAWAAYMMCVYGCSSREWYESVRDAQAAREASE